MNYKQAVLASWNRAILTGFCTYRRGRPATAMARDVWCLTSASNRCLMPCLQWSIRNQQAVNFLPPPESF